MSLTAVVLSFAVSCGHHQVVRSSLSVGLAVLVQQAAVLPAEEPLSSSRCSPSWEHLQQPVCLEQRQVLWRQQRWSLLPQLMGCSRISSHQLQQVRCGWFGQMMSIVWRSEEVCYQSMQQLGSGLSRRV